MLLAYLEGDGETLARKTGMRPGALRLRIHRIRKKLEKLVSIRAREGAD
jgi:predicted kinase